MPTNGKKPKTTLSILYFPVRCIIHLWTSQRILNATNINKNDLPSEQRANGQGDTIGKQMKAFHCQFTSQPNSLIHRRCISPAMDALVKDTVWNHMGKKYMTAKLHTETKKLLIPTKTGTRCLNRDGASTGSGAISSSTSMNITKVTLAKTSGTMTQGWSHYGKFRLSIRKGSTTVPCSLRCTSYSGTPRKLPPVTISLSPRFMLGEKYPHTATKRVILPPQSILFSTSLAFLALPCRYVKSLYGACSSLTYRGDIV